MSLKSSSLFPLLIFLSMVIFNPDLIITSAVLGGKVNLTTRELKSLAVRDLGMFAVAEHNKEKNATNLTFQNLVRGSKQVVEGIKYTLVVNATSLNQFFDEYTAVVLVQAWKNVTKLESFEKNNG